MKFILLSNCSFIWFFALCAFYMTTSFSRQRMQDIWLPVWRWQYSIEHQRLPSITSEVTACDQALPGVTKGRRMGHNFVH